MTPPAATAIDLRAVAGWVLESLATGADTLVCEYDGLAATDDRALIEATLDAAERASVERWVRADDRREHMLVRGILRLVLAPCLALPPERVPIWRDARGRPHVSPGAGGTAWQVSASRSSGTGAVAVRRVHKIGIDTERVVAARFVDAIAPIVLHDEELPLHAALPRSRRAAWLARAWVCKEAMLKASGLGLRSDPRGVQVMPGRWSEQAGVGTFGSPGATWFGQVWTGKDGFTAIVGHASPPSVRRVRLAWDAT